MAHYKEDWERLTAPHPPPPQPPPKTACEDWCDPAWPVQHCADERCRDCSFCRSRIGCVGDFCRDFAAEAHCLHGECQHCAFCKSFCPKWCDVRYADVHCTKEPTAQAPLTCAKCEFCSAGGHSIADSRPECANWCRERAVESHCTQSACTGCGFCTAHVSAVETTADSAIAPAVAPKYAAPSCANWCRARSADFHCTSTQCSGCVFCSTSSNKDVMKREPPSLLNPSPLIERHITSALDPGYSVLVEAARASAPVKG